MSFSPAKNVRIKSLTPGAVVQLRFGKAAAKSKLPNSDVIVEAKLLRHEVDGDRSLAVFEETDADGNKTETVASCFPGAQWRSGSRYVSLVAVDESTFIVQKASNPIQTEVIDRAIALVTRESEDVYGAEQLIALLTLIKDGNRINTEVKAQATRYANKLVDELSSLPDRESAPTES